MLLYVSRAIDEAIAKFGIGEVVKFDPQFMQTVEEIKDAQNLVAKARQDRANRVELYRKLQLELLPRIIDTYLSLRTASFRKSTALLQAKRQATIAILTSGVSLLAFLFAVYLYAAKFDLIKIAN